MWSRRALLKTTLHGGASGVLLMVSPGAGGTSEITSLSLAQASSMVRRKVVSPVELAKACLGRIERLNPILNAFITITADEALKLAREAESEIVKGNWRGPLHGVPIALKDLIDTAGVRTTAASALFKDRVPLEDAEVVRRLNAAGAVLLGKLNMHEFAYGSTSVSTFFGPVRNPWNPDRIAGGSSGGCGAAVAAELCYGALGSDTAGSIRQPAAYCGITGMKPTYGRVSTRGVIPLSWSLDHIGPMCRSVGDAALLLQAIAGYDPQDTTSVDMPVPNFGQVQRARVSKLRLGLPRSVFYENLDREIEAATNKATEVLSKLTAGHHDVELPDFQTLPMVGGIIGAEAHAFHAPYLAKAAGLYQPETRRRLEQGAKVTAQAYIQARRDLDLIRRKVCEVFVGIDLLVTPTAPVPPATVMESSNIEVPPGGISSLRNTQRFDVYGLPTISIPCGFTSSGMPIGLQISGPPFSEERVLALAHAFERATDWHTRRPKPVNLRSQ